MHEAGHGLYLDVLPILSERIYPAHKVRQTVKRLLSFVFAFVVTCLVVFGFGQASSNAVTGAEPYGSPLVTPIAVFNSPLPTPMPTPIPVGVATSRVVRMQSPIWTVVNMTSQPPARSVEDLQQIDLLRKQHTAPKLTLPEGDPRAKQAKWTQLPLETSVISSIGNGALQSLAAPQDFVLFRNTPLRYVIPITASGVFNEPTAANRGSIAFQTGNTYAALSTDGGGSFSYIDPRIQFPSLHGGFCCDQVAVYDPSRDLMLWLLLYERDATQNAFRLAVSHGSDITSGVWYSYIFDSASGSWYDFPDMSLSNNYLWITANRLPISGNTPPQTAFAFKISLDEIRAGGTINYYQFDTASNGLSNVFLRGVRGAKATMYFGSHNTDTQLRVFRWDESGSTIPYYNVNLSPGWNLSRPYICPGPDGLDWCGYEDGRIRGAWVANGVIGLMWASNAHGSFPRPYVEVARIYESNITLKDRPNIWSTSYAFMYPAASPNARGDLGIDLFYGGGSFYPTGVVGLDDDLNGDPATVGWELYSVIASTSGPYINRWGDYVSVLPFLPNGLAWVATTYSLQGCPNDGCTYPQFLVFGRERDRGSVACYLLPSNCVYLPAIIKGQ